MQQHVDVTGMRCYVSRGFCKRNQQFGKKRNTGLLVLCRRLLVMLAWTRTCLSCSDLQPHQNHAIHGFPGCLELQPRNQTATHACTSCARTRTRAVCTRASVVVCFFVGEGFYMRAGTSPKCFEGLQKWILHIAPNPSYAQMATMESFSTCDTFQRKKRNAF
jgi:hypothetical protein